MPVEYLPREENRAEYEKLRRKQRRLFLVRKVLKRDYQRAKSENSAELEKVFKEMQALCKARWSGGR